MLKARLPALVLLIVLNFGLARSSDRFTKFSLEEEIGEYVELLMGEDAQDDYAEFMHTCKKARTALKDANNCVLSRNLTYERFTHSRHKQGYNNQDREICNDILTAVGDCLRPAVDAVKFCTDDPSLDRAIDTIYDAVYRRAEYLCSGYDLKFPDLFQEGFPECFIRRAGRQMTKCFPGPSGFDKPRDYLTYHIGQRFFDDNNCRLLQKQTTCFLNTLQQCRKEGSSDHIPTFRNLITQFFKDLCSNDYHDAAATGGTSPIAFSWLTLLLAQLLIKLW